MRGHWAAPWILVVTRAGLMEVYPNHTFQPAATVRRADLAQAASKVLNLIATSNPRVAATLKSATRRFPDVPETHLSYAAAAAAVGSGVMTVGADGTFGLARPVTGSEALAAVGKLEELAGRQRR
jgi:hypothetical protein